MSDQPDRTTTTPPPLPPAASDAPAVPPLPADAALQFDRAEFSGVAAGACTGCGRAIEREYYEANGQTLCSPCGLVAVKGPGSRTMRGLKAAGAGIVAAAAGAGLYFLVAKLTGYEFGLIAIVVGFAVGGAVRWGSGGRGGPAYQALAIALTYLAIVFTYVPGIVTGLREVAAEETQQAAADGAPAPVRTSLEPSADAGDVPVGAADIAVAAAFIMAIAIAAPFLGGFQNILGLIIIGIGVYEAWKINRRSAVSGPHPVAATAAAVAS